jgi:DNA-binding transcriptional ArsR family regulator
MPWRVHFTADDLDRIEIVDTFGPLAETFLALSLLRWPQARPRGMLSEWPQWVAPRLTPRIKPLLPLLPPGGRGVDLVTVVGRASTIDQGIGELMTVPDAVLSEEIDYFDRNWQRLPATAWASADARGPGRIALVDAAVAAYGALIAPYWRSILAQLRAEQAVRRRILAQRGGAGLLESLQSQWIRWRPPVLYVDTPTLRGLHPGRVFLHGRGIVIVPSLFTGDYPSMHLSLAEPDAIPMLVFAATCIQEMTTAKPGTAGSEASAGSAGPEGGDQARAAQAALAPLIGRTRATALCAIGDGCTTTELAAAIGTSLAAASQHAAVLREAGLIITSRHGRAVLHTLTPLGAELLASSQRRDLDARYG